MYFKSVTFRGIYYFIIMPFTTANNRVGQLKVADFPYLSSAKITAQFDLLRFNDTVLKNGKEF